MRSLLLASVMLTPISAYAWDTPPTQMQTQTQTQSITATGGSARAHSHSTSSATVGPTTINVDPGAGNTGGWHGDSQRPAASAIAPSFAIAGPCTGQAAALAGQFQLFGLSVGGTDMDKACQSEHLGTLQTPGEKIAFEVLCDDHQFRAATLRAGYACAADRQAAPAPEPAKAERPDYCTAGRGWTEAQLQHRYPECRT